jgi:uncharacterized protein with PIN domain/sulfur carrier protein ThiS
VERAHSPGQTVKDLIEAMGVPHTEVDLVLVDGRPVDFDYRLRDGERVSVYPMFEALDISSVTRVRGTPLRRTRFVADAHLGRLARYLRLLGLDTLYRNDCSDAQLVELAARERRIILTRDRGLLKRAAVDHGYLVRQTDPRLQLDEVIERFDLRRSLLPFSLCPACNGSVAPVAKEQIVARLPARTARCYEEFWRCRGCGRLYWKGGHYRALRSLVDTAAGADPDLEAATGDPDGARV